MSNHEKLEYQTCKKCGIQQQHKNFWYSASAHDVCKYCNKKTNIIPSDYKTTTEDALNYLSKIVFDPKNDTSIFFQTQMNPMFEFLKRKHCQEMENMQGNIECTSSFDMIEECPEWNGKIPKDL